MGPKFLNSELQMLCVINCKKNNKCLHFPGQHYNFQGFLQTFPYLSSFSRIFKALKISVLHSRTFHTFPGSVQTLFIKYQDGARERDANPRTVTHPVTNRARRKANIRRSRPTRYQYVTSNCHRSRDTKRTYTETLLRGLIKSISRSTAHRATTGERSNRVLTCLTLDAGVLVQRTLVNVYVTHTHIVVTSRTHISDVIRTACCSAAVADPERGDQPLENTIII